MAQFYDIDDSGLDYTEGTGPAIPSSVQDVDDDFYGDAAAPPTADQLQFQDLQDPEAGAYSPYGAAPIVGSETDFGDVPLEPIGSPGGGGSGGKDFGGDDMVEVDTDEAAKEEEEEELELSDKFWKLAYYRSFYNVDVLEVAKRIGKVFLPIGDDFFTAVKGNADLYGWLWIASTLVFVMAVTGNFASYLSYAFAGRADEWQYDFTKLTFGALTVYIYVTVMPLLVWVAMKLWLEFEPSVVDYFCLYGYSLAPYIPAAIAMMVPMYFVRWIIVGVAAVSVSVFLARNWIPFLKKRPAESGGILAVMLVANLVLALIFMVYFFNYSVTAAEESSEDASSNEEPQTTYEVESSYYEEPSVTPVPSPSASATPSVTPSVTPTLSVTPTPTVSATTTPTTTSTPTTNAGEY